MELGSGPPIVEIDELGQRWGFEFVEELLGAKVPSGEDGKKAFGESQDQD
jgi:hypothetical protein